MKTKKGLKRIVALVMCVVLLATSLPLALAANETAYNPAPYFTSEAQKEGAVAWMDTEGSLQIRFPAATGWLTHADWVNSGRPTREAWEKNPGTASVKAIDRYIVEISDLGKKLEKHNTVLTPFPTLTREVKASEMMELDADNKLSLVYTEEELGTLLNLEENRYNISITAVDSEGWYSMSMYASIFDVPEFFFDMSKFEFLSENSEAMLEMMRFEYVDPKEGYSGYEQSGDTVSQLQRTAYTGTVDPSVSQTTASTGYRVRLNADPAASGVTQIIDTPESRQTYNFDGADEVWYWMDLTDVELKGVSFRLRANYKRMDYSITGGKLDGKTTQHNGNIVYSTFGTRYNTYTAGEEPYVLVQNANGNWEKVLIQNGTVDIGHFKGYVRIPIQFMCSETPSMIQTNSSVVFGQKRSYDKNELSNVFYNQQVCLGTPNGDSYTTGVFPVNVQVDPAGTPICDALLIQQGKMKASKIFQSTLNFEMGSFLAPGIIDADINKTTANNSKRAYVEKDADGNWQVQNRTEGYKALEDIYSAGFSYTGLGEDSVNHSIFFDNVMFYRTDGQGWTPQNLNGADATGSSVATYYDQRAHAQSLIYDAIDQYIGSPSWTDYRGVKYVQDMISAYYEAYREKMGDAYAKQYFTSTYLGIHAKEMGREETWNNYVLAEDLCSKNRMLDSSNSRPNDIVPMIVQSLEALPDPSTVTTMSDVMREEVIKLYQAYNCLNYGQLKALGSYAVQNDDGSTTLYEEEKLLAYINLLADQLDDSASITGYKMANYPFIPFNTFEDNTELGDKAWKIEDDPNYVSSADYRHVKNFSTLATDDKKVVDGRDQTIDTGYTDVHNYAHAGDTRVTTEGYNGTKGLTTTFESAAIQGTNNGGVVYATYFNKDSVNTATDFNQYKTNNMSSVNLGQLAKNNNSALVEEAKNPDGTIYLPFSLVMYVDFSELTEESGAGSFAFGVKIHTTNSSGESICYRPAMGSTDTFFGQEKWRSYFILDQDPASASFGEWKRVYLANRFPSNYMFVSKDTVSGNGEVAANLAGYKGYIAIPMNHFKRGTADGDFLVEKSTELNNIYSITFGITNENGAAMAGKSFTIDNVGFTYDPDYYKNELNTDTSSRNDASYAEVFGAKSSKAVEFENAVAAIDPYAPTEDFKAAYDNALNLYTNQLKDWQKENVKTVIQAKALLDLYKTYYDGAPLPPAAMTIDELKAKIAVLSVNIPENISTIQPLPHPGFVAAADPRTPGEVNYAGFGFASKEEAQQIAAYYTDTYKRLSVADKESLTKEEKDKLLQAYNAAMRCLGTLEMIKTNATEFAGTLSNLYKDYPEGDQTLHLIKATDRNAIATLSADEYDPLAYYAKAALSGDDSYEQGMVIPAYKGMTDGLSRYLANVKTNDAGEVVGGGAKVQMDKYTALYAEVKTALDAEQLLSDDLYARVKEAIAEYNDLIPAYKNIFELYYGSQQLDASGDYQGIKDILDLFPVYDLSFSDSAGVTEATLTLDDDNQDTASQSLRVRYLEEVLSDEALTSYFTIAYDGLLESGAVTCDYELYLNGKKIDKLTADGTAFKITAAELGLTNNTYTPTAPSMLEFKAKVKGTPTAIMPLSDTAEIKLFAADGTQIGDTSYLLHVNYTPDETYVVYIPAEIPVDWGTTEQDASYKVDCALLEGSSLNVGVTAGAGKLSNAGTADYFIPYKLENGGTETFKGSCQQKTPELLPTLEIAAADWNIVPVARYADTLTYTVTYDKTQTP